MSLAQIQEAPDRSVILLAGPPGAGKSNFCQQVVLNALALDRPVIYVTTERGTSDAIDLLKDRGLGKGAPAALRFVDAFGQTVGVASPERPDTIQANCMDLNSISIAITRLQERMGQRGILLALDSLTSPYLFSGAELVKFIRLFLSRFAAEGNAVVALIDEGCGKPEDLIAMMSVVDGVIKMEMCKDEQLLDVVKHPKASATRIKVPIESERVGLAARIFDPGVIREFVQAMATAGGQAVVRKTTGDFVNLFWPNLAHWSGMLWDPKRFPLMTYQVNREDGPSLFRLCRENKAVGRAFFPWHRRLAIKVMFPASFSKAQDMRKLLRWPVLKSERAGIVEYLEDASKTDEHHFRVHENYDCWGFEEIGAPMSSYLGPTIAGACQAFEYWNGLEREWNAVETKCVGLGDPYCEFKLVPGDIAGLRDSLEKSVAVIEAIHERLMDRLVGFLLDGQPLVERPSLGSDVHLHTVFHAMAFPALAGDRYRMALRMGGTRSGKEVGERLMGAGIGETEALERVVDLMEYCKVGKVTLGGTMRIEENCESSQTKVFTTKSREPACYFTTGFLNGLFSAIKNQHVREIQCIAAGDPYCEWEII